MAKWLIIGEAMNEAEYATYISDNKEGKSIDVILEEEVHPMFMGYIDEEEAWTKSS